MAGDLTSELGGAKSKISMIFINFKDQKHLFASPVNYGVEAISPSPSPGSPAMRRRVNSNLLIIRAVHKICHALVQGDDLKMSL